MDYELVRVISVMHNYIIIIVIVIVIVIVIMNFIWVSRLLAGLIRLSNRGHCLIYLKLI